MALNAKTTNIPTNTGVIKANNVNLTKVIANGVVVWEKISQIQLINGSSISNNGTFSYYAVNGGTITPQDHHYMTTSGNSIWIQSYQNAPNSEYNGDKQKMNIITWSNIDLTSFTKLKFTFRVEAECSIGGASKARIYLTAGNLTSNVIEGTGYNPWSEDGEVNNIPYEYSGSIELDVTALTGAQTIRVNLFHENGDDEGRTTSFVNLYITKLELT